MYIQILSLIEGITSHSRKNSYLTRIFRKGIQSIPMFQQLSLSGSSFSISQIAPEVIIL